MAWNSWVLKIAARAEPPQEWNSILEDLDGILSDKYIDKIEVAAFSIRGERTARWLLVPDDAEFSTLADALGAAKKLTWLLLKSEGAPMIPSSLLGKLRCTKSAICTLLEGHEGKCTDSRSHDGLTKCPVCLETIRFHDFERDGRKDLVSIQMGHLVPLSRVTAGHTANNVVWVHRRCNYIQDEQTVEETIMQLCEIVKKHGYAVSDQGKTRQDS